MTLAIFDLDNTLLLGDSDYAWGQYLVSRGIVDAEHHSRTNAKHLADYNAGLLNVDDFLQFQLEPLKKNPRPLLETIRAEFLQDVISPMITDNAIDLVKSHRAMGHTVMIITATNRFITEPIAKEFEVDILIATEVEEIDGRFTGRSFDVPSFAEGKVTRLRNWMIGTSETLNGSWFYSDSHNDLPLLRLVDNPVALNPDSVLKEYAIDNRWPIIEW